MIEVQLGNVKNSHSFKVVNISFWSFWSEEEMFEKRRRLTCISCLLPDRAFYAGAVLKGF